MATKVELRGKTISIDIPSLQFSLMLHFQGCNPNTDQIMIQFLSLIIPTSETV